MAPAERSAGQAGKAGRRSRLRAGSVRARRRRGRLSGAALAAAAALLALASGVLLVGGRTFWGLGGDPTPGQVSAPSRPDRQPEPTPEPAPEPLLGVEGIDRLGSGARWRVAGTGARPVGGATYAGCAPRTDADPRHVAAYLRSFETGGGAQLAVHAVEVSRSGVRAAAAFDRQVGWYAGCQLPRVQLLDSYTLPRPGTDVVVLGLRRWSDPVRSITVALGRTGVATTVLVHEADRPRGPSRAAISRSVVAALDRLCTATGGECGGAGRRVPSLRTVPPPPTGEAPGFLATVDLPPAGRLRTPWAGTDPARGYTGAATALCDGGALDTDTVERLRSRTFVVPGERVPTRFGISQAVGVVSSPAGARLLVEQAAALVMSCPDRRLSVTVTGGTTVRTRDVRGRTWRIGYELPAGAVYHRVGLVRHGRVVSQVTLSPTSRLDPGRAAFQRLVLRAGQRLGELSAAARRPRA